MNVTAMKSTPLLLAALLLSAPAVSAQPKRAYSAPINAPGMLISAAPQPGACKFNPTDAWVTRQSAFFNDASGKWTDDTLRNALLKAVGIALPLKMPISYGVQIDGAGPKSGGDASAMIEQLKKLAATRGSIWPVRSVVGAAGTHAVYLLAQQDTGLARAALKRMMEAGPDESPAIDVAVLEDRMRLLSGRKQLYGTVFTKSNGKVALAAMEDSVHADLRREGAGLPPFKLGMCLANQPSR